MKKKEINSASIEKVDSLGNVNILDAEGSINLEVPNGKHLEYDIVGSHYENYDSVIVL